MTGNLVFIGVSVIVIAAYTGYNIWLVRRQARLFRKLKETLEQARKNSDKA